MNSPMVLLVGADPWTAQIVRSCAQELGYAVLSELTAEDAVQSLQRHEPEIAVIDLSLPDIDGLALCRKMRAVSDVVLIVLTDAPDAHERIAAFEHGADACLTRPFNPPELLARMRALLRRSQWVREHIEYASGDLEVNPTTRTVTVGERKVELRQREFDLLLELVRRPGAVVTRADLLRRVWGYEQPIAGDTLNVHVHRLRSKLGESGRQTRFIETVKGVGYRFREELSQAADRWKRS